jgi:hypothetical protein
MMSAWRDGKTMVGGPGNRHLFTHRRPENLRTQTRRLEGGQWKALVSLIGLLSQPDRQPRQFHVPNRQTAI